MNIKTALLLLTSLGTAQVFGQGVGINSTGAQPDASAILDVSSTDKGMLIPRMTEAQRDAISNPAIGLQVYNTDSECVNLWNGSSWKKVCGDCDFTTPVAANNGPICEGSTLNLTATTIPGAVYSWSGPNAFSSSSQNPNIVSATASASGTYSLLVTLNGCTSAPVYTTVTVNASPQIPAAGSNGPLCEGSTLNLTSSNIVGASYSWSGPNGFASSSQNPSIASATTAASGTYSVVATVNGCASSPGSVAVNVYAYPSAPTAGSNSPVCEGATLSLTASTVSGATYSWTGPNGFSSADQNPNIASVTSAAAGSYSVVATVNGCSSSAGSTSVTVNSGGGGGSQTFNYTGSVQTWSVPTCVTSINVDAYGAQGWTGSNQGGRGGRAQGDVAVSPGETVYIYVGQQGPITPGGFGPQAFNGGGRGYTWGSGSAGAGGGASDIRIGGQSLNDRIIVAAGGGGSTNNGGCAGGYGGGSTGGGTSCYGTVTGATQTAGGTNSGDGANGSFGQGADAVSGQQGWVGGGGGGWYGGASGISHGSGSGGSSYLDGQTGYPTTNTSTTQDTRTGNGQVIISW